MVVGAVAPTTRPRLAERRPLRPALALLVLRLALAAASPSAWPSPQEGAAAAAGGPNASGAPDFGPVDADGGVPRRATAVGTEFSIDAVPNSNVDRQPRSSARVGVKAGLTYPLFKIHAVSGLGTDEALIRVKLVPYDLALTTCATAVPETSERPFNGLAQVANPNPEETINTFPNVRFPHAGSFRLCYSATGALWEELVTEIQVSGSEVSSNKFWCPLSNLRRVECTSNDPPTYCSCKGKIEGFKISSTSGNLMGLGLPDPPPTPWRATLTTMDRDCGTTNAAPFLNKVSAVTNFEGYDVHDFSKKKAGTELGVWKICYCAGIDADNGAGGGGACYSEAPQDFPQLAGQLTTLDVKTKQGSLDVTVYPTLRFSLVVQCGSNGQVVQPNSLTGGCTDGLGARYKIVPRVGENDKPYYEPGSGCQYLQQAQTLQDSRKIMGGQVGPNNCVEPTRCLDDPETMGPKTPTWNDVQIDATYQNNVMIRAEYDVCYCDSNCENSAYWFKAGVFTVRPVRQYFTDGTSVVQPVVNTRAYLVVEGNVGAGGWSAASDGQKTREMKILRDCPGCVDKIACLQEPMPDVVSGHRLVSGNTDYTEPETMLDGGGRPIGQRYGKICDNQNPPNCVPNLKMSDAGWYAVCYCDSNCNEMLNWAVYGSFLVSGPLQGQSWTRYCGVTFDIEVRGWGLGITNRLLILSPSNTPADCGGFPQSENVDGPVDAATLLTQTTNVAVITAMVWDSRGTEISFSTTHGLVDGDRISLSGVNVPGTQTLDTDMAIKMTAMFNGVHEVYRTCDDLATGCHKVLIPVEFPAAEFPLMELSTARWTRNSQEGFQKIRVKFGKASPEGRGYVVCWSPLGQTNADYVGQAGSITLKDPIEMPHAAVGLTSVMPDMPGGGAPAVVTFTTGDIARYEQLDGQMQLVIAIMPGRQNGATSYIDVLEPRDYALADLVINDDYNELKEANQAFCGKVFLEMWTNDPDGFPQPAGCWFDEDKTDPDLIVNTRGVKQLHVLFSPRNHLKKQTQYMLVLNLQVRQELTGNFPDTGAVWIWSMDDVHDNPFGVIELGRAYPSPSSRVPPRDTSGNLKLSAGDDPRFDDALGFRIHPDVNSDIRELTGFCKAYSARTPEATPTLAMQCVPCRTEQDCGNGDAATPPNPAVTFCVSPIDPRCPQVAGDITNVPAFVFDLKAKSGHPIKRSSVLRIFLHPLTQWNIDSSCRVAMQQCLGPSGGGQCSAPFCGTETVVGGPVIGVTTYPINILKISLPSIMGDIADTVVNTLKVGNIALPAGGFWPEVMTAELMKQGNTAPDYWNRNSIASGGARLYVQPKIMSAALVTHPGEGNARPFRGDQGNRLYIRLVFGATLWASVGEAIQLRFKLPLGYSCTTPSAGTTVPQLNFLQSKFPTMQGRLGGELQTETVWVQINVGDRACELQYRQHMVTYAKTTLFTEVIVDNPTTALKRDDPLNQWTMTLTNTVYNPSLLPTLADWPLGAYEDRSCGGSREEYFCRTDLDSRDYGGRVPVLGKLTETIIAPTNFGSAEKNVLSIFFRTEQEVGTLTRMETEVWVDAPPTFEFGQYCLASQLPDFYYIPEGRGTERLPTGDFIVCSGAPTDSSQLTYNRAKVQTTGRLLRGFLYGFRLEVLNAARYIRSQLDAWRIWTYTADGAGVDGTFETPRFNEKDAVGPSTSFGIYLRSMPAGNFRVSFADLRPTVDGAAPTDITFLPIIVSAPMSRAFRILAPAGFIWYFEQFEFRYKARAPGVLESLVVEGAEQDLPISGVPARPIAEPRNRLTVDYMQSAWQPGVKYGFAAKIIVPMVGPTGSANQFSIEFGYSEVLHENRLEAGVVEAPLVRKLINGAVVSTTPIVSRTSHITFSLRTITPVPTAGGIIIIGPPNFHFAPLCQPKPSKGFPELPYDSTCLFETISSTGQAEVSIVAGPSGIPARHYMFSIEATNPPTPMPEGSYDWVILTYSLMSERHILDYNTTIPMSAVGGLMRSASLIMWPWKECLFRTLEQQQQDPSQPVTYCDFERWQFYPPQGYRDDRPGRPSQLIIAIQPSSNSFGTTDMIVRAPAGYEFNAECGVVTYPSSRIFNDSDSTGTMQTLPSIVPMDPDIPSPQAPYLESQRRFDQRYALWPAAATVERCIGRANVARITLKQGLRKYSKYLFRLSVLRNPMTTPDPNKFVIEYNAESSDPFEGIKIWAFANGTILPTTTAASLRHRHTKNMVTIHLRPVNDLPHGGHMRVIAPSGFVIPTACSVALSVHETDLAGYDLANVPVGLQRASLLRFLEFNPGDVECLGDETPSSKTRLHFTRNSKYLRLGVLYVLHLEVVNPQTTSAARDPWEFYSYRDLTVNQLIDSASIPGFPINSAVQDFAYVTPESNNALARHRIDFNMSFPDTVELGDTISIVAPVTYIFNEPGDSRCPRYVYLEGSMRRTQPRCGANTISWKLEEESIPATTGVRFMVQVQNPPNTPARNLFQVRQTGPDGMRKSSRMIPGYEIIPKLDNVTVSKVPPTGPCQATVGIVTGRVCEGATSTGAVELQFTPTRSAELVLVQGRVGALPFGFIAASFGGGVPTYARSETGIVARMDLRVDQQVVLRLDGARNPDAPGRALWSITTFTTAVIPGVPTTTTIMPPRRCDNPGPCGSFPPVTHRRDETLDLPSFDILGYIQLRSSRVNPIYFGERSATVTFELAMAFPVAAADIFSMTRPPSYTMLEGSLRTFRDLQVGEHGLDLMRRFSLNYDNPEDYYAVLAAPVAAGSTILFSVKADLPATPQKTMNWFFRTYRVLPLLDTDGEVLEGWQVPYPWIGRDLLATGTNDGAFSGFLLVGQIPFTIDPMLQTPGATIRLSFNFALPEGVVAQRFVRLEITGPEGFSVKDTDCFWGGNTPELAKCTGFRNTATLKSSISILRGSDITVPLTVTNPGVTPSPNYWYLAVFKDDDSQYVRWSQALGYTIASMPVVYKGNNQLGESASGFFTFTPVRTSPTAAAFIVVTPPPLSGFRLFCTGVSPLGFVTMPQCSSGGVNEPLELRFGNASIRADQAYTFGVRVYNPGGRPAESENYWGLTLKDETRQTFDGNLRIPGLELKSVPLRCNGLGWSTAAPRVLGTVLVQMRVLYRIVGGSVTELVILAPAGVMYNEDPNALKIVPISLPLSTARPFTVGGDRLTLNLDQTQDIGAGLYNIRFDVSNPAVYPPDNTWSIHVKKDIEVLFSHVFTGYVQGEQSPYDLASQAGLVNAGRRAAGAPRLLLRLAAAALVAAFATLRPLELPAL